MCVCGSQLSVYISSAVNSLMHVLLLCLWPRLAEEEEEQQDAPPTQRCRSAVGSSSIRLCFACQQFLSSVNVSCFQMAVSKTVEFNYRLNVSSV